MIEVVGVRFKPAGKIYYFDPDQNALEPGDNVVLETTRGIECGQVVVKPKNGARRGNCCTSQKDYS